MLGLPEDNPGVTSCPELSIDSAKQTLAEWRVQAYASLIDYATCQRPASQFPEFSLEHFVSEAEHAARVASYLRETNLRAPDTKDIPLPCTLMKAPDPWQVPVPFRTFLRLSDHCAAAWEPGFPLGLVSSWFACVQD